MEAPKIKLIRASEAPEEIKRNPFYNPYHWGMADWEEKKLYIPDDSDEAITFATTAHELGCYSKKNRDEAIIFAVAIHELGHFVETKRIEPSFCDFEMTYCEEERAWREGWKYLEKILPEYYADEPEIIEAAKKAIEKIKDVMMKITKLSEPFYKRNEQSEMEQKIEFAKTEEGKQIKSKIDGIEEEVKKIIKELNEPRLGRKINWEKFESIINRVLIEIEKNNKKE